MKRFAASFIIIFLIAGLSAFILVSREKNDIVLASTTNPIITTVTNADSISNTKHSTPLSQEIFDNFYTKLQEPTTDIAIKGAIVPHHLLAGFMPASVFDYLSKQKPSVIVLFGPNHFSTGKGKFIASGRDYETLYGTVKVQKELLNKMVAANEITIDEQAIEDEHSIFNIMPFIAKSLPNTKVLSFMVGGGLNTQTLDKMAVDLKNILPDDAVIVASVDFSHYQTLASSNFHDEITIPVLKAFDFARYPQLEVDSYGSLYLHSRLMQSYGTQKIVFDLHSNAAELTNNLGLNSGTSHYAPFYVQGEPEKIKTSGILNFGDLMLDRNVKKQIDANGNNYPFKKLAGEEDRFFMGMDAVECNLEGSFANKRRPTSKSIAFRFDPALIPTLKKYNFNLFNLANNHSFDMGVDGFKESQINLKNAGISYYGQQYKINDDNLLVKQIGDFKFGLIGLDDTINKVDTLKVKNLIQKAKDQGAEIIMVNIHWGDEYKPLSNTRQRQLGHTLIDLGVDVIIGHHPHVVEEMEIYNNHPIFYSLGNFVFDQYFSVPTQQELGIGLVFKEENNQKSVSAFVFPLESIKSQIQQMSFERATKYFDAWTAKSRLGDNQFNNFNLKINF